MSRLDYWRMNIRAQWPVVHEWRPRSPLHWLWLHSIRADDVNGRGFLPGWDYMIGDVQRQSVSPAARFLCVALR
jgi:hypothetical protein